MLRNTLDVLDKNQLFECADVVVRFYTFQEMRIAVFGAKLLALGAWRATDAWQPNRQKTAASRTKS